MLPCARRSTAAATTSLPTPRSALRCRRTHRFFEPSMETEVNQRRAMEIDLRDAIAEGAFEIHYQPLVDLGSNAVTGCEALLRWRHPRRGMVSPAEFIPIA